MKNLKGITLICAFILFSLTGCVSTSGSHKAEKALEVAAILKLSDIPIPSGFRLLENESFAFQNNELRIILLKYLGKSHTETVSAFFKEQMPLYNWSLINIVEYGNSVLNFQRDTEACSISIIPQGSKSQIVISINPRAVVSPSVNKKETFVK